MPPYTKTEGRLSLARPITQPGIFLSQPPIATTPSNPWHDVTVSIESAITSLETREYFIPSDPIEIPSDMVIVLKITPLPPALLTPFSASLAKSLICMLHGVTIDQVDAIPT